MYTTHWSLAPQVEITVPVPVYILGNLEDICMTYISVLAHPGCSPPPPPWPLGTTDWWMSEDINPLPDEYILWHFAGEVNEMWYDKDPWVDDNVGMTTSVVRHTQRVQWCCRFPVTTVTVWDSCDHVCVDPKMKAVLDLMPFALWG